MREETPLTKTGEDDLRDQLTESREEERRLVLTLTKARRALRLLVSASRRRDAGSGRDLVRCACCEASWVSGWEEMHDSSCPVLLALECLPEAESGRAGPT